MRPPSRPTNPGRITRSMALTRLTRQHALGSHLGHTLLTGSEVRHRVLRNPKETAAALPKAMPSETDINLETKDLLDRILTQFRAGPTDFLALSKDIARWSHYAYQTPTAATDCIRSHSAVIPHLLRSLTLEDQTQLSQRAGNMLINLTASKDPQPTRAVQVQTVRRETRQDETKDAGYTPPCPEHGQH